MCRRTLLLPVALALLVLVSIAGPLCSDEVDEYVSAEMQKQHIPGLSLAVVKEGEIVKAAGYGLANLELDVPARPETIYKIGSVSKQFIAAGILLLVEDGKIGLDDKISNYLDGTPETWKDITIRHLLSHTSGLVREPPGYSPLTVQSDATLIKAAYALPLRFAPGESWQYCNVGYFALAEIIYKVSGKSWPDFLNERVFAPLEMQVTRTTTATDIVPNRADGYVWLSGKHQNARPQLALRPSGAFISSVLDLAKWDSALCNDLVLKKSSREAMWTPIRLNDGTPQVYGFGWYLNPLGSHRQVRHGGSILGFRAELARLVDHKLTVIILTNCEGASPAEMVAEVAKHYIPGLLVDSAAPPED